jgi:hypothetical protein
LRRDRGADDGQGQLPDAIANKRDHAARRARFELLEVRVDRVRRRDIVARIFDAATGSPLDARIQDGTRAWTGRVPATGEDAIDVARAVPAGDTVLRYWLTVSVR